MSTINSVIPSGPSERYATRDSTRPAKLIPYMGNLLCGVTRVLGDYYQYCSAGPISMFRTGGLSSHEGDGLQPGDRGKRWPCAVSPIA